MHFKLLFCFFIFFYLILRVVQFFSQHYEVLLLFYHWPEIHLKPLIPEALLVTANNTLLKPPLLFIYTVNIISVDSDALTVAHQDAVPFLCSRIRWNHINSING